MSHAPTRLPAQAHAVHLEPAHALVPLGRVAATARDAAPRPPRAPARVRSVAPRPLAERHLRQPQAGAPLAISPWVVRIHATHRPCVCGARAVHTRAQAHVACACTWWRVARACVHMHCSRLAAGGRREAPEAARRRPRRSLQPRAPAAPHGKHPAPHPPTHTTLTRGRQVLSIPYRNT